VDDCCCVHVSIETYQQMNYRGMSPIARTGSILAHLLMIVMLLALVGMGGCQFTPPPSPLPTTATPQEAPNPLALGWGCETPGFFASCLNGLVTGFQTFQVPSPKALDYCGNFNRNHAVKCSGVYSPNKALTLTLRLVRTKHRLGAEHTAVRRVPGWRIGGPLLEHARQGLAEIRPKA
jgi:hypothetical protein